MNASQDLANHLSQLIAWPVVTERCYHSDQPVLVFNLDSSIILAAADNKVAYLVEGSRKALMMRVIVILTLIVQLRRMVSTVELLERKFDFGKPRIDL